MRRRTTLGLGLCLLALACAPARDEHGADPAVTLRFRPSPGQRWREHWIYDLDAPGTGLVRTGLSLDVNVGRPEQGGVWLRHLVKRHYHARDGQLTAAAAALGGVQVVSQWGSDHSLLTDINVEAADPGAARLLRELIDAVRFGMLIEYPDQAISVGDTWSIEPRTLSVGPKLPATLRPSYALEAVSGGGDAREVKIGADIQVDLRAQVLEDNVIVEGGGTASGSLRVRVSDGVLLESRIGLHFNQEVRVNGTDTLGYREFSATSHVLSTTTSASQPNLAAEPLEPEPRDADEARACVGLLDAVEARVGHGATPLLAYTLGALHADLLPRAAGGSPLREAGAVLLITPDGRRLELNGLVVEAKDLIRALRLVQPSEQPLYVLAPAHLPAERLQSTLAVLPRGSDVRLLQRTSRDDVPLPKPTRWLEDRLRAALVVEQERERESRLSQLLIDHLTLCEGALDAYRSQEPAGEQPRQILRALTRCGCTTTHVDGLELTLHALFGSAELRALRLSRRMIKRRLRPGASVQDLLAL
ncbi:MAG: hypothetical protein ABW321_08275 [Polyangiales bacterium]